MRKLALAFASVAAAFLLLPIRSGRCHQGETESWHTS
jgi:hypothetical protein